MNKMVPHEVKYCLECTESEKPPTSAPFRVMQKSMCGAVSPPRKITDGKLDKKTPIPDWCPIQIKNKERSDE